MRQELTETRERLETEHEDAVKLRRRLAEERAALEEERRTTGKKMRTELDDFRRQTAERLRKEEERLRERFEEGRRRGLAAEAVQTLFAEAPAFGKDEPEAAADPWRSARPCATWASAGRACWRSWSPAGPRCWCAASGCAAVPRSWRPPVAEPRPAQRARATPRRGPVGAGAARGRDLDERRRCRRRST